MHPLADASERASAGWLPAVGVVALVLLSLSSYAAPAGKAANDKAGTAEGLYQQIGTDRSFKSLVDDGTIPVGKSSSRGVTGSRIVVNKAAVERGPNATTPIPKDIRIHTLCNSSVRRKSFPKWTRWYQEDGHTQVFRLFQGETNVHNSRPLAARIEAVSALKWQLGDWHEWTGTYTIVKPHPCAIFQAFNDHNEWAVAINLTADGSIILNHRRHQKDQVIAKEMTGKSFDLRVRDNGRDYEVYLNGEKAGAGYYDRPAGHTSFRWGMYDGEHKQQHDAMICVTGAKFR